MISLDPEILSVYRGFKITDTIIGTIIVDMIIFIIIFLIYKNLSIYPSKIQNVFESIYDYFYSLTETVSGEKAKDIFPWVVSFFIFILVSNLVGIFSEIGNVEFFSQKEQKLIPLIRPATSDLNTTFALAFISLFATHVLSIKYNGIKNYIKKYISFNPIHLFIGLLELVSEITKLFSLSFRLFGNIFAGEVVLITISSLFIFLVPVPFFIFEVLIDFIQALVFSMLTMVFMSINIPVQSGGENK